MMRKRWLAVLAVSAAFTAQPSARAEDTYSVKVKHSATGDVVAIEDSLTITGDIKVEDATGKPLNTMTNKTVQTSVYTETTLAKEAGKRPTKLSRQYDKAEVQQGDKTTTLPYQGKTVDIEKKEGKYHFQVAGKDLSGDDAAQLDSEFNKNTDEDQLDLPELILPGKAVALNDSWKIDMGPFSKQFAKVAQFTLDADKAKGTAVLRKVYMKGDRQFGVLHVDITAPVKSMGEGATKINFDDGAPMTIAFDVDGCIDGTAETGTLKMDMKMDGSSSVPLPGGAKGKLTISMKVNGTNTRNEQPKK